MSEVKKNSALNEINEKDLEEVLGGRDEPTVPRVIPEEDEPAAREWMVKNCNHCNNKKECSRSRGCLIVLWLKNLARRRRSVVWVSDSGRRTGRWRRFAGRS